MQRAGFMTPRAVLLGLVWAQLTLERRELANRLEDFIVLWGVRVLLCTVDEEGGLVLTFSLLSRSVFFGVKCCECLSKTSDRCVVETCQHSDMMSMK